MDVCAGMVSGMDDGEIVTMLRRAASINSKTAETFLHTARLMYC
jgi:hypothetical protein